MFSVILQFTAADYANMGFPGADDLSVMFEFKQTDHEKVDITLTKELNPNARTFEQFVRDNMDSLK